MNILVLEDEPSRIEWFRKFTEGHRADFVDDAKTAIIAIHRLKYDVILLDHDLDGRVYVPSDEPNTGFQVAKAIPGTINRDTVIVIHSHNDTGTKKMASVLKNGFHHLPFYILSTAYSSGKFDNFVKDGRDE